MRRRQIALLGIAGIMTLTMTPFARASDGQGTHLVAEAELGLAVPPVSYLGPGLGYGGIVGIGGMFRDFPLRFYFIVGASSAAFWGDGLHPSAGISYSADRTYVDIFGGLRILYPIFDEARVYVDLLGGGVWMDGEVARADGTRLTKQDWGGEGVVAAGLEYRWHENAATGIRLEGLLGGNDVDILDEFAGQEGGSWARMNIMVTQAWML